MTRLPTRRILLRLILDGDSRVVVFDIDTFRRFTSDEGRDAAAGAVAELTRVFEERAARSNGAVHFIEPDRFLVALPASTYEEAVGFAERAVDAVRSLDIPFSAAGGSSARLSVTAAVVSVETRTDIETFDRHVDDLLRDGKSTGGDTIIRDR